VKVFCDKWKIGLPAYGRRGPMDHESGGWRRNSEQEIISSNMSFLYP
jgi:hypothetical protein